MGSAGWNLYHVILVLEMLMLAYFLVHESVHLLLHIIGGAATWREAVRGRYKAHPEELFGDWPGITVVRLLMRHVTCAEGPVLWRAGC